MVDPMSPDASPSELGKRSGVRRVNNLPLYIVGTAFTIFLVIMVVVAMHRADRKGGKAGERKENANTSTYANEIVRNYNEGLIPAKKPAPPEVPEQPQAARELTVPIARPENPDSPPVPPARGDLQRTPADNDLERIRQAKLQMFEQAVKGKTTVQVTDFRGKAATTGESGSIRREEPVGDPTAAYKARLSQLLGTGAGGPGGGRREDSAKALARGRRVGQSVSCMAQAGNDPTQSRAGWGNGQGVEGVVRRRRRGAHCARTGE